MWLTTGFISLGLLIGTLVGLTAESVVTPLLGLLFGFIGGSVIAMLRKIGVDDRKIAGQAIAAMTISCLVGVYSGILVSEHQLLSPKSGLSQQENNNHPTSQRSSILERKYLRSIYANKAHAIDTRLKMGQITEAQAYEELFILINEITIEGPVK